MKYYILPLLLLLFLAVGCQTRKEVNDIVVDRIQYDVTIVNPALDQDWWVNNLEGSKREDILRNLFENAEQGKLTAYDYFYDVLTPEEVRNVGIDTVYKFLQRNTAPYDEYDTLVIERITYRDVTKLRFMEEWIVDEHTLKVTKNVVGMAPIYERQVYEQVYTQVLFWVFFDKRYPGLLRE